MKKGIPDCRISNRNKNMVYNRRIEDVVTSSIIFVLKGEHYE